MLLLLFMIMPSVLSENCSYHYDDMYYTRSMIYSIKGIPTNLVYNPVNKDLHFTLIDLESLENDHVQTRMDQYLLRENELIKIDNVNGQAAAIDLKSQKVYIAADDGLYFLNSSDKAQSLNIKGQDIIQLFQQNRSNDLYAVTYPDNEIYVIDLEKSEKRKVEHVPCAFILAVDDFDNIYYECDSKYLKMLLKGFQEPIEFVGIQKNSARVLATDSYGRVIVANNDGLYLLKPSSLIPTKLMDLDFVPSGLVFDGNDFYVATTDTIYKYSSDDCQQLNKSKSTCLYQNE